MSEISAKPTRCSTRPATTPFWNESGWFGFNIPDRDINGFVYYFHDVRTGVSGGGPALWDPSGQEVYDCLFYDWRWHQPPTGAAGLP